MSSQTIVFAAFVFVLAGFVKGTIGLGLPTVSIGLLAIIMAPVEAAAILLLPSLVTNVWQMFAGPYLRRLTIRLWPMLAGLCIAVWIASAMMLATNNGREASALLGAILAGYAIAMLMNVRFVVPPRAEWWAGPIVGLATGVLSAATGVFAVPSVPYLVAIGIEKDEMIQALGLFFTVATLALGSGLAFTGVLHSSHILPSLLALVMAGFGVWLGQVARARMDPASFRYWFLIGQLVLGVYLLVRIMI